MHTDQLRSILAAAVGDRQLLDHPFYLRWSAGELSVGELRAYAAQYRHVEAAVPGILRTVAAGSEDAGIRGGVERTLDDEVGGDGRPSHLELFDGFCAALGASPLAATPATEALVEVLAQLAESSTGEGLAAMSVYELQSPDVSATKASGLRRHYGLDGAGVAFWDTHAEADVEHAEWLVLALSRSSADEAVVTTAAAAAAGAWWAFLDEREEGRSHLS